MARQVLLVNPRRRTRRKAKATTARKRRRNPSTVARRRAAPVRRRTTAVRRRKNPARIGRAIRRLQPKSLMNTAISALPPAAGAVALDMAWNLVPMPAAWKMGNLRFLAKGIGAILLGELAKTVVSAKTAEQVTMGGLTVVMYEAGRELVANVVPGAPLGYYSAAMPAGSLGEYLSPNASSFPLGANSCPPVMMPAEPVGDLGEYLSGCGGDYY